MYPSYFLITLLSILSVTWYASNSLRRFYLERTAVGLESRAAIMMSQFKSLLAEGKSDSVDSPCKELGKSGSTRITVILADGRVVGDTREEPARMDNHADRPEMVEALAGRVGRSIRFSHTLRQDFMYLAVPIRDGEKIIGALRTSIPLTSIDRVLRKIYLQIALGSLGALLAAGIVCLLVSRRISRPLEEMKKSAERFAMGELEHKIPVPETFEMGSLAETMNNMAAELHEKMNAVLRQRNEMEAVLSSMVEGVLAVDTAERVLSLNATAAKLIGTDPESAPGRSIQEVVRNPDLQSFLVRTLRESEPTEGEIALYESASERFLQITGAPLRDGGGERIGALVVLNDVTRMKRLENVRKEFVANVSHELKTPVTSIKGFVETLIDGAIDDPRDARRFLKILARQADRLNAIIEDLLLLSSIEHGDESPVTAFEERKIKDAIENALEICGPRAELKNIEIETEIEEDLTARVNPALLEQALVNLIDNAVKYSEAGKKVWVRAAKKEAELVLSVRDIGCGIAKEHQPRIFERFYRVDKARRRKLGGTGLGLSIVKHIARNHGGRVGVESQVGKGSTFSIHLPKA